MKEKAKQRIKQFSIDRDWDKYHNPANLAKTIAIEACELVECFQWDDDKYKIDKVKAELADVLINCQNLLDKLNLDEDEIVNQKMDENENKYPVDKIKGLNKKYDEI